MNAYIHDAEHEVAQDLLVPANPNDTPAVTVPEGSVAARRGPALVVTDLLTRGIVNKMQAFGYTGNFLFPP